MISIKINSAKFAKEINNIMDYSIGFLDGVQEGKAALLNSIGVQAIEMLKQYIDSNARSNPQMLQHVYEWYQNGSPEGRLFDINYAVTGAGISINSTFRQSKSIQNGSKVPFYDKARIMEEGIPVTIRPVNAQVLRFEEEGETVFTSNAVNIANPGGMKAQGGFEKTFDEFFNKYFTQAFLKSSGIAQYLENPEAFKKHMSSGKSRGRAAGKSAGYNWIVKAGGVL